MIPTLGVYDTFDEIDFDALPDRFVLKCTHDSGGIRFCRDKSTFDRAEAREYLTSRLSKDPYPQAREFAYKGIRCGYNGSKSSCKHTLADCRSHGNSTRFGGFPGIDQKGVYA